PEGDEACADRDHASLTAPTGFLKHHHGGERPHPPEVGDTCGEPGEHQPPAAPEAEEPMSLAEPERSLDAASVVLEEERAGMAALAQTSLLQARELERPGQHEHGPGDGLGTPPATTSTDPATTWGRASSHAHPCTTRWNPRSPRKATTPKAVHTAAYPR